MTKPTLQVIYQQLTQLQKEVHTIKQMVMDEPMVRSEVIARVQNLASEKSITVKSFRKRYGIS